MYYNYINVVSIANFFARIKFFIEEKCKNVKKTGAKS